MIYDFVEQLNFSNGVELSDSLLGHIVASIPRATGHRAATKDEDLSGTDVWIDRRDLPPVSVDFKHRSFCPIDRWGKDDACIETCSVFRDGKRIKPGWTLDKTKRTDLVVYTWPAANGQRRFWILWFPFLCQAATLNHHVWNHIYGEMPTSNNGYQTLNIYVPRIVIAKAMKSLSVGAA